MRNEGEEEAAKKLLWSNYSVNDTENILSIYFARNKKITTKVNWMFRNYGVFYITCTSSFFTFFFNSSSLVGAFFVLFHTLKWTETHRLAKYNRSLFSLILSTVSVKIIKWIFALCAPHLCEKEPDSRFITDIYSGLLVCIRSSLKLKSLKNCSFESVSVIQMNNFSWKRSTEAFPTW